MKKPGVLATKTQRMTAAIEAKAVPVKDLKRIMDLTRQNSTPYAEWLEEQQQKKIKQASE